MLLGKARLLGALAKAAKASKADQTLIAAQRQGQTTLRFAQGRIHQNFHQEDVSVWVKVACQEQTGVAMTSSLKHDALLKAVDSGIQIAQLTGKQPAPAFSSRPPAQPTPQMTTYFASTAQAKIAHLVRTLRALSSHARQAGFDLAGSLVIAETELAVIGCEGLTQYQPFTAAGLRLIATRDGTSGFAAQTVRDLDRLNHESLLKRSMDYCRMNRDPKSIRPGKFDVLLEPEAVAELVEWLAVIGFGAKQMMDRTSFMAGRMGERLMSRSLSIADDGTDPEGLAAPFDFEGIPKQQVRLIEKGLAKGIVYDSQYGRLYRRPSTGHALSYDDTEGPLPANLFVGAGGIPHAKLLESMDRGLWISRFHYVNGFLNTHEALMTGLTRDGTFLIRKGKVVGAVKNLRFTQPVLEAFSKVIALSQERRLVADPTSGFFAVVTPAILIQDFTFTGQTR